MESTNILITGNEYSIAELFSTNHRKIIIPDFQRDYCWGNPLFGEKNNTDIVSGFIQTLVAEHEQKNGDLLLGKIDVYENPKNLIYLTDGQQRLTTIYLLLGMLHRVTSGDTQARLRRCLLSDFEENNDDKEPYLQYSIRDSSVFFLRDLVNEYFIANPALNLSEIKNTSWYFHDYDLDPTVQSMLQALDTIETKLSNKELAIDEFAQFVIDSVKIQYYDVQDRKHGEERFVIVNTTGKILTTSENVKPILLGEIADAVFSEQWEERETFFWKNKQKDELVADDGVNDFLRWCFQVIEKQRSIDLISLSKHYSKKSQSKSILSTIDGLFSALTSVLKLLNESKRIHEQFKFIAEDNGNRLNDINDLRDLNENAKNIVLLPLLAYVKNFTPNEEEVYQFLRRLRKNYFDYKWSERKSNYINWRYVLQIIEVSNLHEECLTFENCFTKIDNVDFPKSAWFNEDEKLKVKLKAKHKSEIELWEDHQDFMGDLSFFTSIDSSTTINAPVDDVYSKFALYYENYCATIDIVRNFKEKIKYPITIPLLITFDCFTCILDVQVLDI